MNSQYRKKIAIYTLPLERNYGGILQAFALNKILSKHGYDSYVLKTKNKGLKNRIKAIIDSHNPIKKFTRKNIRILSIKQLDEINLSNNNINTIIVGSDQVWRKSFAPDLKYFLPNLSNNINKIAYAASFGIDYWDYNTDETNIIKNIVKNSFSSISIREKSGIELCKKILDINPQFVLDPTLLLEAREYKNFFSENKTNKIFIYLLDYKNKYNSNFIDKIKKEKNLQTIQINLYKNKIAKRILPTVPIETWLSYIYNSEIVITDSFHGCVFSILFNKEFYILPNEEGGNSRISSLLEIFKLENRIIKTDKHININQKIDWESVNNILTEYRNASIQYLLTSIKQKQGKPNNY